MSGPLTGIRVLDLSRIMAGPWAGQMLADLGADVIHVERAGAGDDTRTWGPPYLKDSEGNRTAESGYYMSVNRGKRSVTADISTPEGRDFVLALAKTSDIVLENFKAGTLDRYGIGFEALKAVKEDIIVCSITGFGQSGPRRDQPAYDFMIQAMGGLMNITGVPEGEPGSGPMKVGVPVIDLITGMYAATSVLAALQHRNRTGEGEHVDLAMLDAQVATLSNQAMNYLVGGKEPKRQGNRHPNIQPQDAYPASDGYIVIASGSDRSFTKFMKALGRPELATDEKFAINSARIANLPELEAIIHEALAKKTVAEWVEILDAVDVPCAPINTVGQALADPQVKHREQVRMLKHPLAGEVPTVVAPYKFRNAPLEFVRHPPLLGEHQQEVLEELGIDDPNGNPDIVGANS